MGGAVKAVVQVVDQTITTVGKTVEAVAKNPLPVIESIALMAVGVPPTIAGAIVSAANGGTPEQIAKAALFSSIPAAGEALATASGMSVAASTAIASAAVSVATGSSIEQAVVNGTISAAVSGSAPYVKAQISDLVSSPAVAQALTSATLAAEGTILHGGNSEQIGKSIANSFATSAIQQTAKAIAPSTITPTTNPDRFNAAQDSLAASNALAPTETLGATSLAPAETIGATPLDSLSSNENQFDPSIMSSAIAAAGGESTHIPDVTEQDTLNSLYAKMATENTQAGKDEVAAQIEAITGQPAIRNSSLDFNPDEQTIDGQPVEASPIDAATQDNPEASTEEEAPPEPFTSPIDTSFKADYSLDSSLTPKPGVDPETGTGMTASPLTTGADNVGYGAVDYGVYDPASLTGEPSLGMPESSNIKSMGGAQGLTADVTNPVTGETGTVGELGYTATGAIPVSDPAYGSKTTSKATPSSGSSSNSNLMKAIAGVAGATGLKSSAGTSPLSAGQLAESYLTTRMVNGQELTLPQLKQLYPTVVPELSKLLIDRGMTLTPTQQEVKFGDFPQNAPSGSGSDDLNAVEFANFGQPGEDYQYAAKGGSMKLPKGHRPEFITGQTGHYAQGRGTGQSDDIPAVLHDGDYVVDADTVAAFGDGSSKAGAGALERFRRSLPEHMSGGGQPIPAKIADGEYVLPAGFVTSLGKGSNKQGAKMLDAMREQIRAHKRSAPDTKIPPKAKSPLQYMNEAMKG